MPPKLDQTKQEQRQKAKDAKEELTNQYDLSEEERTKVVKQILKEVEQEETARSEFMSIRQEAIKLYEGIREPKSDPWDNCSNITTMLTAAHCKLMHAMLFPAVWNPSLLYWRPAEKADIDNVENVKKFMHWVIRHDIDMQDVADDAILQAIVDGTIIFKVRWVPEYKWVLEKKIVGFELFGGERTEVEYKYKRFEHAVVDIVDIEDYLQSGPDEQKCSYICQSIYNTFVDLKDMESRGIFLKGSVTETMKPKLEEKVAEGLKQSREDAEGYATLEAKRDAYPVRTIERYGKWEINGKMVESVFTIAYETATYLSGRPLASINKIGRRPFVVGPFIRRIGRWMGDGVPSLLRNLQKEIDAIHNQRIDAGSMSIAPWGVYRAASSVKPETIKISPGTLVPVDDVKDVQLMQFPANFGFSYQEERLIIEYIEKLTVMSSYSFGRESDIVKSRATATSTMALLSQTQQAANILGVRLQHVFARLMTMILQYYQMYMPPGMAERVLGEGETGLELLFGESLTTETIAGNYDAYMELDFSGGNKAMEQQVAQIMLQSAPMLMQLAMDPRGWEICANFLKKLGILDVEKYIGEKPQQQTQGVPGQPIQPGAGGQEQAVDQGMITQQLQQLLGSGAEEEEVNAGA